MLEGAIARITPGVAWIGSRARRATSAGSASPVFPKGSRGGGGRAQRCWRQQAQPTSGIVSKTIPPSQHRWDLQR